jgi:hypothetical protein
VRTTVSIDDDVLGAAKRRAVDEGRTLGELITEVLRERLARRAPAEGQHYEAVTGGRGGARPGVDLANNAALRDLMGDD